MDPRSPLLHAAVVASAIALVALFVFVARAALARGRVRASAERQLAQMKNLFGNPPKHRPAKLDEFPHLDRAFYDQATAELVQQGFQVVGDSTDERLAEGALFPSCVRRLLDAQGTQAMLYHAKPRSPKQANREQRILELGTELSTGEFLGTSNGLPTGFGPTPGIDQERLGPQKSRAEVLARHRARVAERLKKGDGVSVRPLATFEDAVASQVRAHEHRMRYRRSIGWITEAEVLAIAGPRRVAAGKALYRELQRLTAAERDARG